MRHKARKHYHSDAALLQATSVIFSSNLSLKFLARYGNRILFRGFLLSSSAYAVGDDETNKRKLSVRHLSGFGGFQYSFEIGSAARDKYCNLNFVHITQG